MDLDTYRETSLGTWGEMAEGWEARRDWLNENTGVVIDWLVDRANPQPGQTVLDIAGGPGDMGAMVAARVGDDGRVLETDFAPEMVDVARRLGEAQGLANVDFRVLDAERMDLEDASVDAAVCRWGYMLMADPAAALKETRRVLRDGGALAFAVWRTPDLNPWVALPGMTLVQRGHMPPPEPGAPGIFALGDPDHVRSLVTGAGFDEPEIESIDFGFNYRDADDIWDAHTRMSGPLAEAIKPLSDEEKQATRDAVVESLADYRNDDGSYSAPAATWGVTAR